MKHEKPNEAMNEFLRAGRTISSMTLSEEIVQDPTAAKINEFIRRGAARGRVETSPETSPEAEVDRPESGD